MPRTRQKISARSGPVQRDEGEFQVIAELVEVLERKASFGGD